jgi:hypothetical protein
MAILMQRRWRALAGRWCCMLALLLVGGAAWAEGGLVERQVKAAYLFKFASFVEWPEGSFSHPGAVLTIGVAGNDALAEQLDYVVSGRSINGHAVAVRRVRRGDKLGGVHILFVGGSDRAATADLLETARNGSVLTVSESPETFALGSMVNFVINEEKVRFEVALRNVNAGHLRISARMLSVATRVLPGGGP